MTRALVATGFAVVLALSGCSKPTSPGPKKSGPAVAQGEGVVVTVAEFQARLDEQSPFLRQRYQNLERKKEFLDSLVKFEILANAAEKEGYQNDPDVQLTLKKAMVQKLVQKRFGDADGKDISDADVQKFYDEHKDDFVKAARVRTSALLVAATPAEPGPEGRPGAQAARRHQGQGQEGSPGLPGGRPGLVRRRRQQGQRRRPGLPLPGRVRQAVRRAVRGGRLRRQGRRRGRRRDAAGLLDRPRLRPAGGGLPHRRAGEAADPVAAPAREAHQGVRRLREEAPRGGQGHGERRRAREDRGLGCAGPRRGRDASGRHAAGRDASPGSPAPSGRASSCPGAGAEVDCGRPPPSPRGSPPSSSPVAAPAPLAGRAPAPPPWRW